MKVLVCTVSDRAAQGIYEDLSGPAIETVLLEYNSGISIKRTIVPDEADAIRNAFLANMDSDIIITTGGTGLSPRDITPDVTASFCDRLIPGIAEYIRIESLKETPNAALSRGVAGIKNRTIIINLPGSPNAAGYCARLLTPIITHALSMMNGMGHGNGKG
jgi:molybdenum cofactor synthesis domain-containing protein